MAIRPYSALVSLFSSKIFTAKTVLEKLNAKEINNREALSKS